MIAKVGTPEAEELIPRAIWNVVKTMKDRLSILWR